MAVEYLREIVAIKPEGFLLYSDACLKLAFDDILNRRFVDSIRILELFKDMEPTMRELEKMGEITVSITVDELGPDYLIKKM
jgi:hypothetical protein